MIQTLLIALSVSIDCFAVAALCGALCNKPGFKNAFKLALPFGTMQGLMPLAGYLGGAAIYNFLAPFDHWIAFIILLVIAINIYRESRNPPEQQTFPLQNFKTLAMLAVATSIDALAIGFSYALLEKPILIPALIFALTSAALTFAGVKIGKKFSHKSTKNIMFIAATVLLAIGIKILLEHLIQLQEYKQLLNIFT